MMLVDETLVSDIARSNPKIAKMAVKSGLEDVDSDISDFVNKGIRKETLLKEMLKFSEETENEDII